MFALPEGFFLYFGSSNRNTPVSVCYESPFFIEYFKSPFTVNLVCYEPPFFIEYFKSPFTVSLVWE